MPRRVNKTNGDRSPVVCRRGFQPRLCFVSFSPAFRHLSPTTDLITFYICQSWRCYFGFETLVTDMERLHNSESEHRGPWHAENKNAAVNPMEEGMSQQRHGPSRGQTRSGLGERCSPASRRLNFAAKLSVGRKEGKRRRRKKKEPHTDACRHPRTPTETGNDKEVRAR